jgi:hypothetical protein
VSGSQRYSGRLKPVRNDVVLLNYKSYLEAAEQYGFGLRAASYFV